MFDDFSNNGNVEQTIEKNAEALQLALSALLSRRLAFMRARANWRRLRHKAATHKKRHQIDARLIDERRIAFDVLDGHWD